MKNILEVHHLGKEYQGTKVLENVNLAIAEGEFVAIMGQSGCGKSTLLHQLGGMDHPTEGTIRFEEQDISNMEEEQISKIRLEQMGFVFQKANLLKTLSVRDNIVFPAYQSNVISREKVNENANGWMERMGILTVAEHDIRKVSGGQLQRASICRALMNCPKILFADEPTGALNSSATKEIMDIFHQINEEGTAILLVTHDGKVASRADRVIYLEDGSVKNQLELGKYSELQQKEREHKVTKWLEQMEF